MTDDYTATTSTTGTVTVGGSATGVIEKRGDVDQFAAALLAVVLLSGCGGGGSGSPMVRTPADDGTSQTVHTVELPGAHGLGDWLTDNPGGMVTIQAGEYQVVGGIRFSCPAGGVDCTVAVTSADGAIAVSSTGGIAIAELVPPRVHTVDLVGLHGLADWLAANPGGSFTVPADEYRDIGGVRFECAVQGGGSPDCEVAVTSTNGMIMISSTDGVASAEVINPSYWIVQFADTLLLSDWVVRSTPFGDFRVQSDCTGPTCTHSAPFIETTRTSLSDISFGDDFTPHEPPRVTETYRGVSLNTIESYNGWLGYNLFSATRGSALSETYPNSMSFGDATGTNPIRGSAAWSGVMVGVDVSAAAYRNRIRGDADLTIADFADPTLDVAFTNIRDVDAGRLLADMTWDDVPMTSGGFGTGSDGDSIQGKFYGPNHEEAGGVFERDQVIGAFGAKRQ